MSEPHTMDTNDYTCDVVIPYRTSYPDTELFFSLQSLDNTPHRDIYLVGDKPKWYEGKHLKPEKYQWLIHDPIHNVENKVRFACEQDELSENFILTNDDIFIIKSTTIKPFNRGLLIDHIAARKRHDRYKISLLQTYDILRHMGVDNPLSYELHIPMFMNKKKRLELSYDMEMYFKKGQSPLMRSIYGNIYFKDSEHMEDVKNTTNFDNTYLSTDEASFKKDIGNHIKLMLT